MNSRNRYMPFENVEEFSDLSKLSNYICESLKVKEVIVQLPGTFDPKLLNDPEALMPVNDIWIGNATFSYIKSRADRVLKSLNKCIEKINQDNQQSFADKLQLFEEVKKGLWYEYQYFNSMNPIRYMSSYEWKINYTEEINGKTVPMEMDFPNSQIDLKAGHWNLIENTFLIRRHLLYEIIYLIDVEIQKLEDELKETKYIWKEKEPYEIHELVLAILASDRVEYVKGNEETFIRDFLSLFGKSDFKFSHSKSKVMKRVTRSRFLSVLEDSLENWGKKKTKDDS